MLPINRSQAAFAHGTLIGVQSTSIPVPSATAVKCAPYIRIVVTNEILGRFTKWCGIAQLLSASLVRRRPRDTDMDASP